MWILAPPLLPPTSRSTGDWRGHLGKADCWISWSHWDTGLSATGHLQSQHLTFHAPHQLLHLFPVHLTVTTCQSLTELSRDSIKSHVCTLLFLLHSPWGTFHVLTIMFNFWIHSTSCSVTTVSDFHIPGRYLSHPTECQLGICQGNSEEHQVFLAHHDMVESWLMDLLKFMNLKSLEAVCEGEERPSALTRAWHTGVVQISLINDVGGGS